MSQGEKVKIWQLSPAHVLYIRASGRNEKARLLNTNVRPQFLVQSLQGHSSSRAYQVHKKKNDVCIILGFPRMRAGGGTIGETEKKSVVQPSGRYDRLSGFIDKRLKKVGHQAVCDRRK